VCSALFRTLLHSSPHLHGASCRYHYASRNSKDETNLCYIHFAKNLISRSEQFKSHRHVGHLIGTMSVAVIAKRWDTYC
jgi:hypothetical protein